MNSQEFEKLNQLLKNLNKARHKLIKAAEKAKSLNSNGRQIIMSDLETVTCTRCGCDILVPKDEEGEWGDWCVLCNCIYNATGKLNW